MLGEEYGPSGDSEWCWYLDPIDGTSHFVDGDPGWMTFVALGRGAEVTVGVIGMPARSQRWWASHGDGAFEDGRRIAVSETTRLAEAVVNDDWRGTLSRETPGHPLTAVAERAGAVRPDLGHGFLTVATGRADVAIADGGHVWDYAAAKVIVEEAGGRFSDLAGRARLDSGAAIATNGVVHDEVLAVIRAAGDSAP